MGKYNGSDAILRLALFATYHKEKDLKKKILKLLKKCSPRAQAGIQLDILDTKLPTYKEAIWEVVEKDLILIRTANQLSDEGFPGMVIYQGEAYGVQIRFRDLEQRRAADPDKSDEILRAEMQEDLDWILTNEPELQLSMGHAVMNHLNLHRMAYDVMLFNNRGFSGILETQEIERGPDRVAGQQVGNSNYYLV